MIRVCIICEGPTEKEFVENFLYPLLLEKDVFVYTDNLRGNVSADRIARFVRRDYSDYDYISTLVDFYGFQQSHATDKASLEQEIMRAARALFSNVNPSAKFLPYVQMYEFEGLLFSDVGHFEWVLLVDLANEHQEHLQAIRNEFDTPEDINNSQQTAPSKRLESIFGGSYDKVQHGWIIAESIGLEKIREECPNFNQWLNWLESLTTQRND